MLKRTAVKLLKNNDLLFVFEKRHMVVIIRAGSNFCWPSPKWSKLVVNPKEIDTVISFMGIFNFWFIKKIKIKYKTK